LRDHSEQVTIVGMLHGHDPTGVPLPDEAASYYFKYIDRIASADIVSVLEAQLEDALAFFSALPAEASLFRYAPDKWSVRQVLGHINDCERLFVSRAFWFARGFDSDLPSFDQNVCDAAAHADQVDWADHVEEFRALRLSTLALFRNLPAEAWSRRGVASGNPFSVRALAYIVAGHADHHLAILRERYVRPSGAQ
jgi:hypothetical protein